MRCIALPYGAARQRNATHRIRCERTLSGVNVINNLVLSWWTDAVDANDHRVTVEALGVSTLDVVDKCISWSRLLYLRVFKSLIHELARARPCDELSEGNPSASSNVPDRPPCYGLPAASAAQVVVSHGDITMHVRP